MSYRRQMCPICRQVKRMSGETCGMRCRNALVKQRYGKDFFRVIATSASAIAARRKDGQRRATWATQYPDVPYEAALAIRTSGYRAGYNACHMSQRRHFEKMRAQAFDAGYRAARMEQVRRPA